jgi:hypothetical protein
MRFELGFRQVRCSACGGARIVGVACPHCGAPSDPREADPARQRRTRRAQIALAALSERYVEAKESWSSASEALPEITSWLEGFLDAIAHVSDFGDDGTAAVVRYAKDLVALGERMPTARKRPWLAFWRCVDEILVAFHDVARTYLLAVSATIPLDAQRHAKDGQSAIDRAEALATDLAKRLKRAERIGDEDTPTETLVRLIIETRLASASQDILDIEAVGADIYRRVTGNASCDRGVGLLCALTDVLVDVVLDRDRYWSLVGVLFAQLTRNTDGLRAVVSSPSWRADIEDAAQHTLDASVAHHAVAAASSRDRDHIRAALTLLQDVLEGPAKRHLATLVSVVQRADYEALRKWDAGAIVQRAAELDLDDVTAGLDEGLRNARAHEDYRIEGDRLVITHRGSPVRELSFDEFADAVLLAIESALAVQLTVACAAATVGIDPVIFDALQVEELPSEKRIELLASLIGLDDPQVEQSGATVTIRCTAEAHEVELKDAVMLSSHVDTGARSLVLKVRHDGSEAVLAGPLEPLHRFRTASDEFDKQAAFIESSLAWTLDDRPLLDVRHRNKWVAMELAGVLSTHPRVRARVLRGLQSFAQRLGDVELEARLRNASAVIRSKEMDLPISKTEQDALDWFAYWERQRVATQ